jgi:hypothetical protein
MIVLPDRNRNGAMELAVLNMDPGTGEVIMDINDGFSGAGLSSFSLGSGFTPLSMILIQDSNRNRFPELGVLSTATSGEVFARVIDSGTGAPIADDILFSAGCTPLSIGVLPDMNRNRVAELALLEQLSDGSHAIEVMDISNGSLVRHVPLSPDHIPEALLIQRQGPELFVLGVDRAGAFPSVQVKNLRQERRSRVVLFEGLADPSTMLQAPGLGKRRLPGLAVLGRDSQGEPMVAVKNSRNGSGNASFTVP